MAEETGGRHKEAEAGPSCVVWSSIVRPRQCGAMARKAPEGNRNTHWTADCAIATRSLLLLPAIAIAFGNPSTASREERRAAELSSLGVSPPQCRAGPPFALALF
jgi:hypothetical protein